MRLALVLAALAAAITIYLLWIRPSIRNLPHIKGFYDDADTFWQKVMIWLRVQWDMIVAGALIGLPEIPDLLQQLTAFDLSSFIPSDTAKTITTLLGIAALLAKAFILKRTS